ncbi:MAG: carbohydrate kinase family protein, partial [Eubacteriales bacterium]|nr:carbohydrate kinase family protein [Eubacteriales bacterium]
RSFVLLHEKPEQIRYIAAGVHLRYNNREATSQGMNALKCYDVLCAGLMVMDVIVTGAQRQVFDQDTQYVQNIQYATGGDALNVAINLAKLGARVAMAGNVGNDAAGTSVIKRLDTAGIGYDLVHVMDDSATATSIVFREEDGERHFLYHPGANDSFTAAQLTDEVLAQARILYIGSVMGLPGLERGQLAQLLKRARAKGVSTVMDACHPRDDSTFALIKSALPYVDVFIPSLSEAMLLTGQNKPDRAARILHENGVALSGVKLGKEGSLLFDGQNILTVPAVPCKNLWMPPVPEMPIWQASCRACYWVNPFCAAPGWAAPWATVPYRPLGQQRTNARWK